MDIQSLKTIYYSLVESHLTYGILAWGGVGKTILNKLIVVQKRILKIMIKKDVTYPSNTLYKETSLMDPRQLFFYHSNIYQHKTQTNLKKNEHTYNTRNKNYTYLPPRMQKTIGQKSYSYISSRLYNHLPNEIQDIFSQSSFKKQLRKYVLSIPREQIHDMVDLKI